MRSQTLDKKSSRNAALAIIAIAAFLSSPLAIHAASLSFSPAASSLSAGNIVSVKALVSTDGKSINNANVTIRFPADMLEVVSVTKGSSVFPLWVEEPAFSNSEGSVSFNGGIPNPGFVGQGKEIVSIAFRAKKQGEATLLFSDSAVRANDGLGTDILSSTQSASVRITGRAQSDPSSSSIAPESVPERPMVTSSTHPLQGSWYPGSAATFSWSVPAGVTSVQTLLSVNPTAVPFITYDSSVSQRTVSNLDDGVLYFHIRYMNSAGWGPIARHKIQIDSTAPEVVSASVASKDGRDVLSIAAKDSLSGIASYFVAIDEGRPISIRPDELVDGTYVLPFQAEGPRRASIVAQDIAGNRSAEAGVPFVSTKIVPPTLDPLRATAASGDRVTITGKTLYPKASVEVLIQKGAGGPIAYEAETAADGSFSVVSARMSDPGRFSVRAQIKASESLKSEFSNPLSFQVMESIAVSVGKTGVRILAVIIPLTALAMLLLVLLYVGWHKFFGMKKRIAREAREVAGNIHKALMLLRDETARQITRLEMAKKSRALNRKEEEALRELQGNIDSVDAFVRKEIEKIR
jgi:hypothetical protein